MESHRLHYLHRVVTANTAAAAVMMGFISETKRVQLLLCARPSDGARTGFYHGRLSFFFF